MNILIIEDDDRVADFLYRGLRAEGYFVQVVRNGVEGLGKARETATQTDSDLSPTLLILDVMLPGMNGLEICQTLRTERIQMPILMLSALGGLEDRVAGLRLGADDYLAKPFAFEELLVRITALTRRSRYKTPAEAPHLIVADLIMDRQSMRVTRSERSISLTARELALLELLMSAPGRLFSRERILSNVWGTNEDPLTNIVDVYIRRLRTKIDEDGNQPLIHTVRGLGYRLEKLPSE